MESMGATGGAWTTGRAVAGVVLAPAKAGSSFVGSSRGTIRTYQDNFGNSRNEIFPFFFFTNQIIGSDVVEMQARVIITNHISRYNSGLKKKERRDG